MHIPPVRESINHAALCAPDGAIDHMGDDHLILDDHIRHCIFALGGNSASLQELKAHGFPHVRLRQTRRYCRGLDG